MAASVAEGAISLLLSCARLPSARTANLAAGKWNWTTPLNLGLAGKTAGLVGLGSIGKAIATRLAAFDMRLRAVRRSGASAGDGLTPAGFDWVGGAERMEELVSTSDFLIICAPLTPETENLFDSSLMAHVRSGTSIVNVGRGAIINEQALMAALDSGRLHAAGLDTLRKEPPEDDSPLLRHPRIVVTPHDAGVTEVAFDGVTRIIARNLAHLEADEPLEHRVV
jgi:phosphoglycerate dehydrogenase-like enzyme